MISNNIKTGYCNQCGTYNSSSLRCNCAKKVLKKESEITAQDRDRAFAQTGQFLSDEDISTLLDIAEAATNLVEAPSPENYIHLGPINPFPILEPTPITPKYYGAKCKCGAKLDPYVICDAYSTTKDKGSAWNHAVKKLLRVGDGHKLLHQDIQEVIDTLKRWQEQINA